jgi:signal transduction histidine kinase/ActR/RegA family two-component response regulator
MAAGQGTLPGKTLELSAQRRGGEEFPLEISLSTMRLRETTHMVGIMRDITERKRMESQLSQALKMESVGQLAGGVAHDFNNILAVLMMQISLLKREPTLPPALLEPLGEMEREAKRAANLTRQLLMYSRRQVMQTQVLDLNALVDNLLKMLGRLLGEHIQISFERWARPAWVEADSGMLEQVVTNLCVNARDAMPKGGQLRLGIAAREINPGQAKANLEARPGTFICLAVSDNGCGMDEATLKRIFDPFFTTKEVGKGTGLGLATVYGIVKQHQGWVEVESQVGAGTSFLIYLPVTTPAEPPAAPPRLLAETVAGGSETLLLVEDDRQVRRALCLFLRGQGYQVIEAGSGVEALRLWNLHQSAINLLLTDMVMPEGMTGLELADQLRARKPELKVIISSGYSSELLGPGGKLVAKVLYLPKPCEATLLAKTVRECLDARGSGNA